MEIGYKRTVRVRAYECITMEVTAEVDEFDFTELKQKLDKEIEEHAAYLKVKGSGVCDEDEEHAIYEE
jgi:hypothetical protein